MRKLLCSFVLALPFAVPADLDAGCHGGAGLGRGALSGIREKHLARKEDRLARRQDRVAGRHEAVSARRGASQACASCDAAAPKAMPKK